MRPPPSVLALLARQDGLATAAQLRERGLSLKAIRSLTRHSGWRRVLPGVLLAGGHPWTNRARVRAAGLWVGPRGAVSGPAAAWWFGMLARPPARIEVTIPRGSGLRARRGVVVRGRDPARCDVVGHDGIALTTAALTARETAATLTEGSVFLDRALQRHVRFPVLYRSYCRNLGARGMAKAGALLVAAADRADSAAERRMVALLRKAGLTGWVRGHAFGPWRIDIAFPVARLAIEVDGWAWHVDVERFRHDRRKGNALTAAGWTLLRFTWHDLTNRPAAVLAEIRAVLRSVAA